MCKTVPFNLDEHVIWNFKAPAIWLPLVAAASISYSTPSTGSTFNSVFYLLQSPTYLYYFKCMIVAYYARHNSMIMMFIVTVVREKQYIIYKIYNCVHRSCGILGGEPATFKSCTCTTTHTFHARSRAHGLKQHVIQMMEFEWDVSFEACAGFWRDHSRVYRRSFKIALILFFGCV